MNKLAIFLALMLVLSSYGILANSDNSNSDIPKTCTLWYDGCNTCTIEIKEETTCVTPATETTPCYTEKKQELRCTEKACLVSNPTKCLEYSTQPSVSIQKDCNSWFDGCNTCALLEDGSYGCTDMACETYKEPKCMDDSKETQSGCKLVYDGCNTCLYDADGEPGKCTEKACIAYESPKCLDSLYKTPTKETGPVKIPVESKESEDKYLCGGCTLDEKCYPFGYRKSGAFCSDQTYEFVVQSESEIKCENNFECSSNLCLSGKCVNGSLVDKVLNWFKAMFE